MKKILFTLICFSIAVVGANAQVGMQRTAKGLQYQIIGQNAGDKIKQNDVITFQVVQKTDRDSILFSTYNQGQPVKVQVHPSTNIGDLMDIFPLLAANDSAVIKLPVDSVFKGHETERPPFLKAGSNLVFNIKILKIQTLNEAIAERNAGLAKIKADEKLNADGYITSHKLVVKTTPSGLKYIITRPGTKPKPLAGDTLLVNYTGRLLNGQVFDTSVEGDAKAAGTYQQGRDYKPISFPVGQQKVIAGWDEGLLLMNEGSKAQFIIPSGLAYGDQGNGPTIPPFSTLLFDVEIVKVSRIKHIPVKPALKTLVKTPPKKRAVSRKKN